MADEARYPLSFTSGALLSAEATAAARLYLAENDWGSTRQILVERNLLQTRTRSSALRRASEIVQRLSKLTRAEILLLNAGNSTERGFLLWIAACRTYRFIGEFAEEVLRERFLTLEDTISKEHFDGFFAHKSIWHEELVALTQSTRTKLRSNLFLMMSEASLLNSTGQILPALLPESMLSIMATQSPSDIRFFPTRQSAGGVL